MTMIEAPQKSNGGRRRGPKPGTLVLKESGPAPDEAAPIAPAKGTAGDVDEIPRKVDPRTIVQSSLNVPHREPTPELIGSVRTLGVIEPLIVRAITPRLATVEDLPRRPWVDGEEHLVEYELVAGERRWKSAMICEQRSVLVIVRQLTDEQAFDLAVAENLERADLDVLQEAALCATHRDRFGRDANEIAVRMQRSARWVQQRLLLLRLAEDARQALRENRIHLGTALEVALLDEGHRAEGLAMVLRGPTDPAMPVREARAELTKHFHMLMVHVPFDPMDRGLVPRAGSCTTCPKRTGTQLAMSIEGLDDLDRCTDRDCWTEKSEAAWQQRASRAREQGVQVFDTKAGGQAKEAAVMMLAHPEKRGMVHLDAVCDVAGDALVKPVQEVLEKAKAYGDPREVARAEAALRSAEQQAEGLTWRKVIGEAAAPVAIIREERQGRDAIVELGDEQTALRAIQNAGLALPAEHAAKLSEKPAAKPRAAAWEVEERAQRLWMGRVIEATVPAAEKARAWAGPGLWRGMIAGVAGVLPRGEISVICERRGWKHTRSQGETAVDAFERHVAQLKDAALRGLFVEIVAMLSPEAARVIGEAFGLEVGKMVSAAKKVASTSKAEAST